jgi:hypothetical protein
MKRLLLAAGLLTAGMGALAMAGPAFADPNTDDVHCFIVAIKLADSTVPALQTSGLIAQLYFMGKLDGRAPGLDMETLVMAELPKMLGDLYQSEAMRCGKEMAERGKAEVEMGKDMQKRAAEILKQENTH